MPDSTRVFLEGLLAQLIANGLRIIVIITVLFVAVRSTSALTGLVLRRLGHISGGELDETHRRLSTLAGVITAVLRFAIIAVGGIMLLREVGFDVGPLIASAGILGVAIGFGSQQLVKDFLTGFFILMENQYRVGDSVKVAGFEGVVERISLRTTWVRDVSGAMFIIPNSKIDIVANQTFDWARAVVEVPISYAVNLDGAVEQLRAVLKSIKDDPAFTELMLDDGSINCVERLEMDAAVLRVVVKTRALKQWAVQREIRKRIVEQLAQGQIPPGLTRVSAVPLATARNAFKAG